MQVNFVELEAKELFETMRTAFSLLVQALSVLAVANITVVGFAIANKTAGLLILGTLIDLLALSVTIQVDAFFISPIFYRAFTLRKQLGIEVFDFFPVFLATYYRASLPSELEALTQISDLKERTRKLHRLFMPSRKRFSKRIPLFSSAVILQLLLVPILVSWFGWKMF